MSKKLTGTEFYGQWDKVRDKFVCYKLWREQLIHEKLKEYDITVRELSGIVREILKKERRYPTTNAVEFYIMEAVDARSELF